MTECPTCGLPALPDGPDAVIGSTDGPLLLTRWRCAGQHWWHTATDALPPCTAATRSDQAPLLASDISMALARYYPGRG